MRRGIVLGTLCAAVLVTSAAGAGYFLRPAPPPASLESPAAVLRAPATSQQFTDSRKVQVRLVAGPDITVTVGRAGVLTSTGCAPGGDIQSGTIAARVDDAPILALHLDVPPFRNLATGVEGADVRALQTELNRLGLADLAVDGHFGWATGQAVAALRDRAGMGDGRGLSRDELLWLPQETLSVTACSAGLGAVLAPDAPFAVAEGALQRLVIDSSPADLVPGERTLTAFGVTGTVEDGGGIGTESFLVELAGTQEAQALLSQDPSATAPATLQLAAAVDALQVPASAVFDIADGTGCIQSGGEPLRVTVLGSALGASLVSLLDEDAAAPEEVDLGAAITHDDCEA